MFSYKFCHSLCRLVWEHMLGGAKFCLAVICRRKSKSRPHTHFTLSGITRSALFLAGVLGLGLLDWLNYLDAKQFAESEDLCYWRAMGWNCKTHEKPLARADIIYCVLIIDAVVEHLPMVFFHFPLLYKWPLLPRVLVWPIFQMRLFNWVFQSIHMTVCLVFLLRFTWTRTFSPMQGRRQTRATHALKPMCALFLTLSYLITYTLRDTLITPMLLFTFSVDRRFESPSFESYVCKKMGRAGRGM